MRKKKEDKKNPSRIIRRIMPVGLLSRRLGDAFGNSVYLAESIDDTLGTLEWAADENLIDGVSAYDDDIAPWTADNRGRVIDQQDQLMMRRMQDFLEDNDLVLSSFGCDLTRDAMFRNGALTSPDEAIRQLAMRKIERAAYIAKTLGTKNFRLSIGREGYEESLGVNWKSTFNMLAEGLNGVTRFINSRNGFESIELMTGYSRKLRGNLYMGSPMQAAFMMSQLNQPAFWRLCIENDDLSYMPAYSVLAATNSLAYMPFGGEDGWNWNAHIANIVSVLKMLGEFNWSGNAECLFAPLRTEADDKERELSKRQFIINSMTALTLAIEQEKRLVNGWNAGLSPSESGLMAVTLCNGMDVDEVLRLTVAERNGSEIQSRQRTESTPVPKEDRPRRQEPQQEAEKPMVHEEFAAPERREAGEVSEEPAAQERPEQEETAEQLAAQRNLEPQEEVAEEPAAQERQEQEEAAEQLAAQESQEPQEEVAEESAPLADGDSEQAAESVDVQENTVDARTSRPSNSRAKSRINRRKEIMKGSRSVVKRRYSRYARKK